MKKLLAPALLVAAMLFTAVHGCAQSTSPTHRDYTSDTVELLDDTHDVLFPITFDVELVVVDSLPRLKFSSDDRDLIAIATRLKERGTREDLHYFIFDGYDPGKQGIDLEIVMLYRAGKLWRVGVYDGTKLVVFRSLTEVKQTL